jgi:5-methylcytosine-specific restriction endonuclease McrA
LIKEQEVAHELFCPAKKLHDKKMFELENKNGMTFLAEITEVKVKKRPQVLVTCTTCRKSFYKKYSLAVRTKKNHYCSHLCRRKGCLINCLVCKKEFYIKSHQIGVIKHCSTKCSGISRIGKSQRKQPMSLEERKLRSDQHRGAKCNFWKGGVTQLRKSRLDSFEWKLRRKEAYERDKWCCSLCEKHCRGKEIQAHHVVPWSVNKDDSLENLITLCSSCHSKTENKVANELIFKGTLSRDGNNIVLTSTNANLIKAGMLTSKKLLINIC